MDPSTLLKRLRTVADVAGTIVLRHYGRIDFSLKPDQSVFTEADGEVEDYLRLQLAEILPEAAFIGEESGNDASLLAQARESEWVWVVDPIDGTAAFVDGMDTFCVCIGLLKDGQPYAGAVAVPAMGHRYSAVRGEGAWYDGRPIEVVHTEPNEDRAVLCISRNAHRYLDIRYKGKAHSFGSTALHFLLVARGAAVAAIGVVGGDADDEENDYGKSSIFYPAGSERSPLDLMPDPRDRRRPGPGLLKSRGGGTISSGRAEEQRQ